MEHEDLNALSYGVIGACMEVHRQLGPGLLESVYEECIAYELALRDLAFERQVELPLAYKGHVLVQTYRMDLVVEGRLVLELKAVERVLPVHEAQVVTYLRLANLPLGLLVNFHTPFLRDQLRRFVLDPKTSPRPTP